MSGPPEITVVAGLPSPEEAEAARRAIVALWRADAAAAARAAAGEPWQRAARFEAARSANARAAWSRSLGFARPGEMTARRVGRGDTR